MKNILKQTITLLFVTLFVSYFNSQITASSLMVNLDQPNTTISYSFNFSGTFYKVETSLYKNSVSPSNKIAFGVKEDESDYANIIYPPGYVYSDFMDNQNSSAYTPATKYFLVIDAWEQTGGSVANYYTQTLTYTPPAPQKPDFSIARIQIYRDKFNTNDYSHLFFDSQDTANYPGTAFNKGTKYKFVVTVYNTGSLTNQNSTLTLIQGLSQSGTYPSGTALKTYDAAVSIANTNIKTVEFYETLISPSQDYVPAYLAFHIDKNNTADELNENNNIKIQQASLYPTSITIPGKSANLTSIKVFNEKGNLLKEYSVKKDEKIENKIVEDFGAGNYFIKSENNITRRLKISK